MAKKCWIEKLKKKPKFAIRRKNRCSVCGRARSYLRKFGLCRICFRSMAHQGVLPGVTKSRW